MFALVYWDDSQEVSVIPYDDVKEGKDKNDGSVAKWGKAWYDVKILKISEKKDWLESLDVTKDGKLITPERKSLVSADLLLKKRMDKRKKKENKLAKRDAIAKDNEIILKKQSIFENVTSDSCLNTEDTEYAIDENDFNNFLDEPSTSYSSTYENNYDVISKINYAKPDLNDLTLSSDDMKNLKYLLQLVNNIDTREAKHHLRINKINTKEVDQSKEMELADGTGVFVDRFKATSIQQMYARKPKIIVRQLMKLILGEEVLRHSSPTGKNNRTPIPSDVYEAVIQFINQNAKKEKYKITYPKYREVLTQMCATLRSKANVVEKGTAKNRTKGKQEVEKKDKDLEDKDIKDLEKFENHEKRKQKKERKTEKEINNDDQTLHVDDNVEDSKEVDHPKAKIKRKNQGKEEYEEKFKEKKAKKINYLDLNK